jgi:Flp pilus assembly protein protease CpaA
VLSTVLIAVAVAGSAVAVCTDLRWRIIPNWLTYPLIAFGILAHFIAGVLRSDYWEAASGAAGAALAFVIGYALWAVGGWAGGDVKLFTAYGAIFPLGPPTASSAFYPFFLTILFNSMILVVPFTVVYGVIRKLQKKSVLYETVRITELREGMIPAELIYRFGGRIHRISGRFVIRPRGAEILADPNRAAGLTREQVSALKKLARRGELENRIKLKRGVPFGPFLAGGLITGLAYGDIYWKLLVSIF